jgi:hypothetical protein
MAVDVQDGGTVFFCVDDVFVPDLVVKRACHRASFNAACHFMRFGAGVCHACSSQIQLCLGAIVQSPPSRSLELPQPGPVRTYRSLRASKSVQQVPAPQFSRAEDSVGVVQLFLIMRLLFAIKKACTRAGFPQA